MDNTGDLNLVLDDAEKDQMRADWQDVVTGAQIVAFGDAFRHRGQRGNRLL